MGNAGSRDALDAAERGRYVPPPVSGLEAAGPSRALISPALCHAAAIDRSWAAHFSLGVGVDVVHAIVKLQRLHRRRVARKLLSAQAVERAISGLANDIENAGRMMLVSVKSGGLSLLVSRFYAR